MKNFIKKLVKNIPPIKQIILERDNLLKITKNYPPGHYYSPLPNLEEVRKNEEIIWSKAPIELPGINLNVKKQLALLEELKRLYKDVPFKAEKGGGLRYYFKNSMFLLPETIILFCMLRKIKPKRIIEVGSGFSSAAMMDTNELFFDNSIEMTFIEPYPDRLISLMKTDDRKKYKILSSNLQETNLQEFFLLEENDLLFIDSTHVSKVNSDVNFNLFKIIPMLKKGVYIHFHDIFYPFEYPKEWIYDGRAWNEAYILRAFLEYNEAFEIVLFNSYLEYFHESWFKENMPLCLNHSAYSDDGSIRYVLDKGQSIYLRKIK